MDRDDPKYKIDVIIKKKKIKGEIINLNFFTNKN